MGTCLFIVLFCYSLHVYAKLDAFNDAILHDLKWIGRTDSTFDLIDGNNAMDVLTENGEKYKCHLPKPFINDISNSSFTVQEPLDLLGPLFAHKTCSYRLENYWSYELCHGSFIKQYHEDRDGKKIKKQEYFLGRWNADSIEELKSKLLENNLGHLPMKKIEGNDVPYLKLNYTQGTLCDLNGQPRRTDVLYMCLENIAKQEMHSLKEIETCHYEIIFHTSLLCLHPTFRSKTSSKQEINCVHEPGSPLKPKNLLMLELQSLKLKHESRATWENDQKGAPVQKLYAVFSIDKSDQGIHVELRPLGNVDLDMVTSSTPESPMLGLVNTNDIYHFLSGKECLNGGFGYWKFEICYGKHVIQYHLEKGGLKNVIFLGTFNVDKHKAWYKRKIQQFRDPKTTTHFYSEGSYCEDIKASRETEVRMKCTTNGQSPTSVTVFLAEPTTCKYVLGIESSLLCEPIKNMDEYGLFVMGDIKDEL